MEYEIFVDLFFCFCLILSYFVILVLGVVKNWTMPDLISQSMIWLVKLQITGKLIALIVYLFSCFADLVNLEVNWKIWSFGFIFCLFCWWNNFLFRLSGLILFLDFMSSLWWDFIVIALNSAIFYADLIPGRQNVLWCAMSLLKDSKCLLYASSLVFCWNLYLLFPYSTKRYLNPY